MHGLYYMSKSGLVRIRDDWHKVLMIGTAIFFIGVGFGYWWRMAQVGG